MTAGTSTPLGVRTTESPVDPAGTWCGVDGVIRRSQQIASRTAARSTRSGHLPALNATYASVADGLPKDLPATEPVLREIRDANCWSWIRQSEDRGRRDPRSEGPELARARDELDRGHGRAVDGEGHRAYRLAVDPHHHATRAVDGLDPCDGPPG